MTAVLLSVMLVLVVPFTLVFASAVRVWDLLGRLME